ncbi:triose-phosphate isomerase [Patescibacteria group bacterium]|nr:triose-phosphate isomerase [Patescibacteria group bacterium]
MKSLIVANWKMNPQSSAEAKRLFNSAKRGIKKIRNVEVVICPPFTYLSSVQYQVSSIKLGGQNCFWKEAGPFTGEVSPKQLLNLGCKYAILGHSERRRYFGETDEIINRKIKAAISVKLNPIFCIGETKEEREKGQTQSILKSQIEKGLPKISKKEIKKITIAYEPVWAIGTGKPCNVEEAQKMGLLIRKMIVKKYSRGIAENLRIIYGGSVNSKNATDYVREANFQGLLVGGASLNPREFIKILRSVSRVKS